VAFVEPVAESHILGFSVGESGKGWADAGRTNEQESLIWVPDDLIPSGIKLMPRHDLQLGKFAVTEPDRELLYAFVQANIADLVTVHPPVAGNVFRRVVNLSLQSRKASAA